MISFYYTVGCPPGFFLDTSTKQCRECDIGSYQDTKGQVSCQSCPWGYTTKSKNSDSEDDCYRVKALGNAGKNIISPFVQFMFHKLMENRILHVILPKVF